MKFLITNTSPDVYVIDIDGVIGEHGSNFTEFKQEFEAIDTSLNPTIRLNIRSVGGDVNEALLIYDMLIERTDVKIVTCCYGYVASAATIVAQAADEGNREISSNALYLIHKSMCNSQGNSNNLNYLLELLDKTDQQIASIYSSRSGKPIEDFIELMNKNNGDGIWLTPQEAHEAGLVDTIVSAYEVSENKNEEIMNFSKHWQSILNVLGLEQSSSEMPINEQTLEIIENKISSDKAQIISLEAENARLNALATQVEQKEDPSESDMALSSNQKAYKADIQQFK